jgi:membrane-bound serine protease (ClpP class)
LAIGGIISLLLGSMLLFRSNSSLELVRVSRSVIISATLLSTLFFLFVIGMALKAQRRKPVSGIEGMVGAKAVAMEPLDPTGAVKLQGEIWNAQSLSGRIDKGETVLVKAIRDLVMYVEKQATNSSK